MGWCCHRLMALKGTPGPGVAAWLVCARARMQDWEERLLWEVVGRDLNLGAEPSCTHRGREGREGAAFVHPQAGAVFRRSCCVNKEPPVLWGTDVGLCEPPLAF